MVCFLKVSILSTSLVFTGRLFHRVGAAATNALSPRVLVFITGRSACVSIYIAFTDGPIHTWITVVSVTNTFIIVTMPFVHRL